jgi:tRNA A-37 threonylcarbamoyl transferase component Bud32
MQFLKHFFHSSRLLLDRDLDALCAEGKVLEKDPRGIKVVLLTNGNILKIFRARNLFSGSRVYSHARRFCRNAARLHDLGIPTVKIDTLFHLEKSGHTAVLYKPLEGESIRNLVKQNQSGMQQTANKFGVFLSTLHEKGIHFHSLHTGNILLLPNNDFGLIDISDMTIYPWALNCSTRLRSFTRLCKYQEDFRTLGLGYWQDMLSTYLDLAHVKTSCKHRLLRFKPF